MPKTLVDKILLNPTQGELAEIFMLGYDMWAEDQSELEYLAGCKSSKKYQQGTWHVLYADGEVVSAHITYTKCFGLPSGSYGIGSLATMPRYRNCGYASELMIRSVARLLETGATAVYLFSDIDKQFYEKFGFVEVVKGGNSHCMILTNPPHRKAAAECPTYF